MAMRSHLASAEHAHVNQVPDLYWIRISGQLGPMALSAFPSMVSQVKGDTLLTGILDRSALYGVLAQIEALALDLVELRRLGPRNRQDLARTPHHTAREPSGDEVEHQRRRTRGG